MQQSTTQHPTGDELAQYAISTMVGSARGCDVLLTRAPIRRHTLCTTEKKVVGGESPNWSGKEPLSNIKRLFCRLGMSSYGRPGGGSRKARRCSIGLSTSVSGAHPFESGLAVQNPNWSNAMITTAKGTSVPAIFNFQSSKVRIVDIHGDPWFVAKDVCEVLGHTHTPHAMRMLDKDEKGVQKVDTLGGAQRLSVINESGLYVLVMRSRKPEVRKFAKWVTSEVLPEIRRTGNYQAPQAASPRDANFNPEDPASLRALIKLVPRDFLPTVLDAVNSRMPTRGGDLQNPAYYHEARNELFKFADSLPPGAAWPHDEATRQRIADGYLSDMLLGRRWLVSFDPRGRMQFGAVPTDAAIITMAEVAEFIREVHSTDRAVLMEILLACADRLNKVRQ